MTETYTRTVAKTDAPPMAVIQDLLRLGCLMGQPAKPIGSDHISLFPEAARSSLRAALRSHLRAAREPEKAIILATVTTDPTTPAADAGSVDDILADDDDGNAADQATMPDPESFRAASRAALQSVLAHNLFYLLPYPSEFQSAILNYQNLKDDQGNLVIGDGDWHHVHQLVEREMYKATGFTPLTLQQQRAMLAQTGRLTTETKAFDRLLSLPISVAYVDWESARVMIDNFAQAVEKGDLTRLSETIGLMKSTLRRAKQMHAEDMAAPGDSNGGYASANTRADDAIGHATGKPVSVADITLWRRNMTCLFVVWVVGRAFQSLPQAERLAGSDYHVIPGAHSLSFVTFVRTSFDSGFRGLLTGGTFMKTCQNLSRLAVEYRASRTPADPDVVTDGSGGGFIRNLIRAAGRFTGKKVTTAKPLKPLK